MKTITKEVVQVITENVLEIKDIIGWLEKRGILARFLINLHSPANVSKIGFRELVVSSSDNPDKLIGAAFVWSDTPEGHTYWLSKEGDWYSYLKENNIYSIHID